MTSGRRLVTVGLILAFVLLLQLSALAEEKAAPANFLRLECPGQIDVPQKDTVVSVNAYLTLAQEIGGFSLGFRYDGEGVELKNVTVGPTLPKAGQFISNLDSLNHQMLIGWVDFTGQMPIPAGKDIPAFTMSFSVPKGAKAQFINIDSTFIAPAGHWVCSLKDGGSIAPAFFDCEGAAITIGKPAALKKEN